MTEIHPDGDSSFTWETSHFYASAGDFTVSLISGGDTVSKVVHIGIDKPEISGDSIICDTAGLAYYSVANISATSEYIWEADGGTVFNQVSPYEVAVDWMNSVSLKLVSIDQKNGCKDSTIIPVANRYFIENLIEDSNQVVCNNSAPPIIHGSAPSSSSLHFTYQWRMSSDSLNWTDILGATGKDLQPDTLSDSVKYYQRVVYLIGCDTFYSNVTKRIPDFHEISNNSITVSDQPDFVGCSFEITGSVPVISGGGIPVYTWYLSHDDSTWNKISSGIWSQQNLTFNIDSFENFKLFRTVGFSNCLSHSDTQSMSTDVKITQQPQNYATCNNRVFFKIKVDNPNQIDLDFTWMFSDSAGGTIDGILSQPWQAVDSLNYFEGTGFYGNYYVCEVNTVNCGIYSDWASYTRNPDTSVYFIEQPYAVDSSVYEWDSAVIVVVDSSRVPVSEVFGKSYTWQYSFDNVNFTNVSPSQNLDTLIDADLLACRGKIWYRVQIQSAESCPYATSASVGVLPYKNSDLWSKDSPADLGNEPNQESAGDYWNSKDIWNNIDPNNTISSHQNPEYKNFSPNRIFVRVRNQGLGYSKPASLYLYWTLPSTREDWPDDWKYDLTLNGFYNADSGITYPLGSEINDTAILIGSLAPNADTVVSYDWWPPNPAWYYTDTSGTRVSFPERMLCFLSRIEECEAEPHGMATSEVVETTINVKNNDNIVTKNVTLFNRNSNDFTIPVRYHFPVVIGRQYDMVSDLKLVLDTVGPTSFFDYGNITIVLDDSLYIAWVNGGEQGSGFSADGNRLRITDIENFSIANIIAPNSNDMQAIVELELFNLPYLASIPFNFRFTQYSGSNTLPDGGVYLEGAIPPYVPSTENKHRAPNNDLIGQSESYSFKLDSVIFVSESNELEAPNFYAYPIPFSERVTVSFNLEKNQDISLKLFDSKGSGVYEIETREYQSGKHNLVLNLGFLAPGSYTCRIISEGNAYSLNLIISR